MTSKQRAYLKGLAMNIVPVFQIGKSSLTPEITQAVDEALEARELIKITVLKIVSTTGVPSRMSGGADPFPGGSGNRKKDRVVPSCEG